MTEWNEELEKKILRKSRFTLTIRILRLLLLGVLVYGVYMVILTFSVDKLQIAEENDHYTKLALDWTVPNLRGAFGFEKEEISALGTSKLSYPLVRKVGKEDVVVGTANITKRPLDGNSFVNYQMMNRGPLNAFSFYYPEDPRNGNPLAAEPDAGVWSTLDQLHEGTVAELGFSTDRFMTAEELIELLEPYDIDVLWMPLHAGEFTEYTPGGWGGSGDSLSVNTIIGLAGGRTVSDDYQSSMLIQQLDAASIAESQNVMLENMEALLADKSASYYEGFLGLGHLNERYDYLKANGFTVYGAVVTGPVKELLKLQDEEMVTGERLGEVELWNWDAP